MPYNHPFRFLFVRIVLGVLLAVIVLTATFVLEDGTTYADTPGTGANLVNISTFLSGNAGNAQQSAYRAMITSLRNAVGHAYRANTQITQTDQTNREGLVSILVSFPGGEVRLWFTAWNLYLRGFQTVDGTIVGFNDYNLVGTLSQRYGGRPSPGYGLGYASSYPAIQSNAGGVSRGNMRISYTDILDAARTLAASGRTNINRPSRQRVAQSLLLMIQWTAEAARFNGVYTIMSDVMGNPFRTYHGLSTYYQAQENSWSAISTYGRDVSQNPNTPPRFVDPQIGWLRSFSQV